MSQRKNDMIKTMAPPLYSMNSCFFDTAFMALFGSNDDWINKNFLTKEIDKKFEKTFIPSLHLRANHSNSIYSILHKKNPSSINNNEWISLLDYIKSIPYWRFPSWVLVFTTGLYLYFCDFDFYIHLYNEQTG